MRRRLLLAAVALAMSASTSLAAGPRIVSMNICTDQLLLALADPAQIIGLSRFSRDARQGWVEGALQSTELMLQERFGLPRAGPWPPDDDPGP